MQDKFQTIIIGMLNNKGSLDIARRVYNTEGISPCIPAHASDTIPKIVINNIDKIKNE